MIRCRECDAEFELVYPEDELVSDVAYCPECDAPVNLQPPEREILQTQPLNVYFLQTLLLLPVFVGVSAAVGWQHWPTAAWTAGYLIFALWLTYRIANRSNLARAIGLGLGWLVAGLGTAAFLVGIPLICAWGLGLFLMALSLPVIGHGICTITLSMTRSVRDWCNS
jgi:hypothetical protein